MYSIYIKAPFTTETIKKNTTTQSQNNFSARITPICGSTTKLGSFIQGRSHILFQESILTEALHDTPTFEVA